MKKALSISLLLFLICCDPGNLLAQRRFSDVPGYLGKRVPITLNLHAFPALARTTSLADLQLNLRSSLHLEYVLNRAYSLYGQASILQTSFEYERDSLSGTAQIRASGFELGVRMYSLNRQGNLAPLGFHHQIGLMFIPYQVEDRDGFFSPGKTDLGSFRDFILTYGIGDQRIIHPSIICYFNIQGGWLFNLFPTQPSLEATEVKALATSRLRNFMLLNLTFGIGFILF